MEVLCEDDVLGFEVSVDDSFGVQVGNGLQNLGQVEQHDFFLLFHQIQVMLYVCY